MEEPFDLADEVHRRILEHLVTLFVGESLFVFLEKSVEPLSDILVELLIDVFSFYATKELNDDFTSHLEFISKLFYQSREIWSRDFGLISRLHFEDCCKMIQTAVTDDLNNEEEDSVTPNLKLDFYKHLCITPTRKLVSSHVLFLLNHFNHALNSKRLKLSTKSAVLKASRYMLSHLNFKGIYVQNSSSSMEDEKQESSETLDSATKPLWSTVKTVYEHCYKLTKSPSLRTSAIKVMIQILRKCPKNFFISECDGFLNKIRLTNYFEYSSTFVEGLEIVYELLKGVEKYGDFSDIWYPKTEVKHVKKGDYSLEFRYSSRKYIGHRIEDLDNTCYELISPHKAFEVCFWTSKITNNLRSDMLRSWEEWKNATEILYKIMIQICIEDLEYGCEQALPSLIELGNNRVNESDGKKNY